MHRLSQGIQALDLHASHLDIPSALASLRFHVLSYLSDLETRLALLDFSQTAMQELHSPSSFPSSPPPLTTTVSEPAISHSSSLLEDEAEPVVAVTTAEDTDEDEEESRDSAEPNAEDLVFDGDDVAAFIQQGLELLRTIRAEVSSYLPDVSMSVDFDFDLPASAHVAAAAEAMQQKKDAFRTRLTEFGNHIDPHHQLQELLTDKLPDFADMVHMPSRSMDALRARLSDLAPGSISVVGNNALGYVPRLKEHLASLQAHMQDLPFRVPSTALSAFPHLPGGAGGIHPPIPTIVTDLLADLLEEDTEEAIEADIQKEKRDVQSAHVEIHRALEKSENGLKLIEFDDLPFKWRNNRWVRGGYRSVQVPTLL